MSAGVLPRRGDIVGDRYRLRAVVGRGGMATVYRAIDLRHDRDVAIKFLRPELPATAVDGFLNEIALTAKFHHPNIVPLLDSGASGGVPYFVMPFVPCRSLRDRLTRDGPRSWVAVRTIMREVAGALEYAHDQGVVHLDVKPENILLSEGHAYVTDFGIARACCSACTFREEVVGTPEYMSPEQALGDPDLDARSDVYSFAAVIHEVLTGAPPYRGLSPAELLAQHLHGQEVTGLDSCRLSAEARAVLAGALARRPEDRVASPTALVEALDRVAAEPLRRSRVIRPLGVTLAEARRLAATAFGLPQRS